MFGDRFVTSSSLDLYAMFLAEVTERTTARAELRENR